MPRCASCNRIILWGGQRAGSDRFCGNACLHSWPLFSIASELPEELVREHADNIFRAPCPRCGGPGPVDVHYSNFTWSLVVYTRFRTAPMVTCSRCARRQQALDAVGTLLCGWWSFPLGLLCTPVVVGRNIVRMVLTERRTEPSRDLLQLVRLRLGADMGQNAGEYIRV